MELQNPKNGDNQTFKPELRNRSNGESINNNQNQHFYEEIDSACSTPYVSAPSSPSRVPNGYFFSAPASPMHFVLSSSSKSECSVSGSFDFDFSARFSSIEAASMISADELFLNGRIRPMKLSSHLQRPQVLAPLLDLEEDDERKDSRELEFVNREDSMIRGRDLRLRDRSLHRKTRSLSPIRNASFQWHKEHEDHEEREGNEIEISPSIETTPSVSASSSRSSSSSRNSKRWEFLKDFLRSKSEGRGNTKEKFWNSISFSPSKSKKPSSITTETKKPKRTQPVPAIKSMTGKPANGVSKRRIPPSPHELHYKANRAQAEELKKRTFLPYRQGLLGCLGFSSKGYGAMNVFARSLNPISSRDEISLRYSPMSEDLDDVRYSEIPLNNSITSQPNSLSTCPISPQRPQRPLSGLSSTTPPTPYPSLGSNLTQPCQLGSDT